MKGLLYKDCITILKMYRTYLLMLGFFLLIGCVKAENTWWAFYGIFLLSAIVSSLTTYDEQTKWLSYCDILPVKRSSIVLSRYILTAAVSAFAVLFYMIVSIVFKTPASAAAASAVIMFALSMLTSSVSLYINIRFGTRRGQLVRLGFMAVIIFSATLLSQYAGSVVGFLTAGSGIAAAAGMFVLIILVFLLSAVMSVRYFQDKDL